MTHRIITTALVAVPVLAVSFSIFLPQQASATGQDKVAVCKYDSTPDGKEVLKSGKNPIDVSVSTLKDFTGTFPFKFTDAQGNSIAIGYWDTKSWTASDCPGYVPPSTVPVATKTVTATATATVKVTETIPGPTTTVTQTLPGATAISTVTETVTLPAVTATATRTVTLPQETVTKTVSGPTTTVTQTADCAVSTPPTSRAGLLASTGSPTELYMFALGLVSFFAGLFVLSRKSKHS